MTSSQNKNKDIIFILYSDIRTVFRLKDAAMLINEPDFQSLNRRLHYYVKKGRIGNPRKGIYTKLRYNQEEMACLVYTPSYISLEYVLQKAGIIFQFDSRITAVSYLSRSIEIDNQTYLYRRIKGEILVNTLGIIRHNNHVNIATPERAFLDMLYLNKNYYFDNINPLNKELVYKFLYCYQSDALVKKVKNIFKNG